MMDATMSGIAYEAEDRQVSWLGIGMLSGDGFDEFISNDVVTRLHDAEGEEDFATQLQGLATTGFAKDSLEAILAADVQEEREWAIGESVAEAYLGRNHNIAWPWNMERDKRVSSASLPGADLVGLEICGEEVRLALGEVKTSSDKRTPPNVMNGRSGMAHQIANLASNLELICKLLKWLLPRCKGTHHEAPFNAAMTSLLESGNRAIALFGVLIRDTQPNELDLKARGMSLAETLQDPTTCQLIAIHLPCTIADLPALVLGSGS